MINSQDLNFVAKLDSILLLNRVCGCSILRPMSSFISVGTCTIRVQSQLSPLVLRDFFDFTIGSNSNFYEKDYLGRETSFMKKILVIVIVIVISLIIDCGFFSPDQCFDRWEEIILKTTYRLLKMTSRLS